MANEGKTKKRESHKPPKENKEQTNRKRKRSSKNQSEKGKKHKRKYVKFSKVSTSRHRGRKKKDTKSNEEIISAVTTRSASLARGNLLALIEKLANDKQVNHGPEAFIDYHRNLYVPHAESTGRLALHVISNSVTNPISDLHLKYLVSYRNIVLEELERLYRSVVTKLVFDPKHRNLLLLENKSVIGGICFRMFPQEKFSEIAIMVSMRETHGYGSYMMNHFKDYCRMKSIYKIVTHAANEAFGFFVKQGFKKVLPKAKAEYSKYILYYSEAILVECEIDPDIVYSDLNESIRHGKKVINALIKEFSKGVNI